MEEHGEERPKLEEDEEAPSFYYEDSKKEHKEEHEKEHLHEHKKEESKKQPHHEEDIVIKIKPRTLERAIFITIIIILALLLIFNLSSKKATEQIIEEQQLTTPKEEQQEQTSSDQNITVDVSGLKDEGNEFITVKEETTKSREEEKKEEEKEPEREIAEIKKRVSSDKVELTIDELEIQKKKDATGEYTWGKIALIYLTVSNLDRKFIPSFEIYAYDEDTKELELKRPKKVYNYDMGISQGQRKVLTIDTSKVSISGEIDSEKTVLIKLIDKELGNTIKEVSKTVTIS
jgi:hypothetical protein